MPPPGDQAIVAQDLAVKRQKKILELELISTLEPKHVKNLGGFSVNMGQIAYTLKQNMLKINCYAVVLPFNWRP